MKIERRSLPVPPPPPSEEIILTLSIAEAYKLRAVTYNGSDVRVLILEGMEKAVNVPQREGQFQNDQFLNDLRLKLNSVSIDTA